MEATLSSDVARKRERELVQVSARALLAVAGCNSTRSFCSALALRIADMPTASGVIALDPRITPGSPSRLEPPFLSVAELDNISAKTLRAVANTSTTGTSAVETLKSIVLHFFNVTILVPTSEHRNPRLPGELHLHGLKTIFSPQVWKETRDAGQCLPSEQSVDRGGEGQIAFCLRRLREWIAQSHHPDAPTLLNIINDPVFQRCLEKVRLQMDRLAKEEAKRGGVVRRGPLPFKGPPGPR